MQWLIGAFFGGFLEIKARVFLRLEFKELGICFDSILHIKQAIKGLTLCITEKLIRNIP